MGDMSEIRSLVVVVSFMSCLVLFLLWMPHEQFEESIIEARLYSSPDDFDISEIMAWNKTYRVTFNFTMDHPYHIDADDSKIGHDLNLYVYTDGIALEHFWYWFSIPCGYHEMEWYDATHKDKISEEEFGGDEERLYITTIDNYDYGSIFYVECKHLQLKVTFSYDTETYSNHVDAFDNEALAMSCGVEWEIEKTTYNAWDLIGMLLIFDLPDVHPWINALMKVPLWVCISYLCYVLVIKVIPFIAG